MGSEGGLSLQLLFVLPSRNKCRERQQAARRVGLGVKKGKDCRRVEILLIPPLERFAVSCLSTDPEEGSM